MYGKGRYKSLKLFITLIGVNKKSDNIKLLVFIHSVGFRVVIDLLVAQKVCNKKALSTMLSRQIKSCKVVISIIYGNTLQWLVAAMMNGEVPVKVLSPVQVIMNLVTLHFQNMTDLKQMFEHSSTSLA